jgi:ADP-ribose pyrophosphatase YjhB (NUDIX family)
MTPGESVEECALREFVEETGWSASLDGLFGIYSRPSEQTHTYPNGDRVQFVTVVFQGKVGNRMGIGDGEATELDFFSRPPTYNQLTPTDLPIIRDYFLKKPHPVVR